MNLEGLDAFNFDFSTMFSNIGQQVAQAAPVLVKAAIDKKLAKAQATYTPIAPTPAPVQHVTYTQQAAPQPKAGIDPKLLIGGGVLATIALVLLMRK